MSYVDKDEYWTVNVIQFVQINHVITLLYNIKTTDEKFAVKGKF